MAKLIITAIKEKESHIKLAGKGKSFENLFFDEPAQIHFVFEIAVVGDGDFNDYLNSDNSFNHNKVLSDILEGKLEIKAYK